MIIALNLTRGDATLLVRMRAGCRMKAVFSAISILVENIRNFLALLKESCLAWLKDKAPSMRAALAFYAILLASNRTPVRSESISSPIRSPWGKTNGS